MEREDPTTVEEVPGRRWEHFAGELRGRLQLAPMRLAQIEARRAQRRQGPACLEETRRRICQATGRVALRYEDLRGRAAQPADEPTQERKPALLDPVLQRHLERFLRFRLPKIQVHTTPAADALARRRGADAVTARDAIYFRRDAFQPQTPAGMALLAHEATHIGWDLGARPRDAGRGAQAHEERTALANEQRYLAGRPSVPMVPPAAAPAAGADAPAPAPPAFVQTAMSSRDTGMDENPSAPPPPQLSAAALSTLKSDVYRMLLDKLRSEFERGA